MDLTFLNTLRLKSLAEEFIACDHIESLKTLHQKKAQNDLSYYILGGGSNIVVPEKLQGTIIHVVLKGKGLYAEDKDAWYVKAAAGEMWHEFVLWTLKQGYSGLENLALIPGTVGAAPIQNIGAYGVEIKDYLDHLWAYDFDTGETIRFNHAECQFAYRDSIFKHLEAGRFVITEVVFRLPKNNTVNTNYGEIQSELERLNLPAISLNIAQAVINVRQRKLPDPTQLPNAGSFFKNPVLSTEKAEQLQLAFPTLPLYPLANGTTKLAAGWLIEQAGWKGKSLGPVGMYEKQALVLVNHGSAVAQDVQALCLAVQRDVEKLFGVMLEPEPVFWGNLKIGSALTDFQRKLGGIDLEIKRGEEPLDAAVFE